MACVFNKNTLPPRNQRSSHLHHNSKCTFYKTTHFLKKMSSKSNLGAQNTWENTYQLPKNSPKTGENGGRQPAWNVPDPAATGVDRTHEAIGKLAGEKRWWLAGASAPARCDGGAALTGGWLGTWFAGSQGRAREEERKIWQWKKNNLFLK